MKISVILPAYNAARYISLAIESTLAQTHRDFELIIVDDGSSDETPAIIQRYAERDARIRPYLSIHRGVGETLNHALAEADSEWVAVMHADDIMEPIRLEKQIAFVKANPDIAVVSSFVYYIDQDGRRIGAYRSALTNWEAVSRLIAQSQSIGFHHPAVMMRKSIVQAVGGYLGEMFVNEDIELWTRIAREGHKVVVQPEFLLNYRIHEGSLSVRKRKDTFLLNQLIELNLERFHAGLPDLPVADFLARLDGMSLVERIEHNRQLWGEYFYKRSAVNYANGKLVGLTGALICSTVLSPMSTVTRIVKKFRLPRAGV